ncbi:MAG: hypothetical protein QF593_07145 [Nitrospinota bacterium]|jgi:hypothetical protein|nr:hypothetical protein [Nitrospinota bacterium]
MFDVLKRILVRYREAKRVHAEKVAQLIAEHSREIFSESGRPHCGQPGRGRNDHPFPGLSLTPL